MKIFAIKVSSFTESYRILDKDFANELATGNINMKNRGRENNFPLLKMVRFVILFISKHVACYKIIIYTKGNSLYKFLINNINYLILDPCTRSKIASYLHWRSSGIKCYKSKQKSFSLDNSLPPCNVTGIS